MRSCGDKAKVTNVANEQVWNPLPVGQVVSGEECNLWSSMRLVGLDYLAKGVGKLAR